MRAGGIVLCGGHSTRMGQPKAWLAAGPETMLARVVRILGSVVSPVVVVAAVGQDLPALPVDVTVVRDARPDQGPLEGLSAGLAALDADAAFLTAVDHPLLLPGLVRFLLDRLREHEAAIPCIGGQDQPLASALRVAPARAAVQALLDGEHSSVRALFDRLATTRIGERELRNPDPELESFRGANTPAEYRMILARLQPDSPGES